MGKRGVNLTLQLAKSPLKAAEEAAGNVDWVQWQKTNAAKLTQFDLKRVKSNFSFEMEN